MVRTLAAAPYQPGDYVQALHNSPRRGTCLITARVVGVGSTTDHERPWAITYDVDGQPRTVSVDGKGRDRDGYVQRATHQLAGPPCRPKPPRRRSASCRPAAGAACSAPWPPTPATATSPWC
jgi:hypothetical protein